MPTVNLAAQPSNVYLSQSFKKWALAIFVLGIILRIVEFFFNRSLWCDEGLLGVNLLNRDFAGLLKPLDKGQVTPILFLWLEKLTMEIFGNNDLSLRVVPVIISLFCLYLFNKVAIKLLGEGAVTLFVLLVFSTSILIFRYTLEVKQYQGDMLVALFFWWQLLRTDDYNKKSFLITMFLTGCIAVWFSHTAVVVLLTAGGYLLYTQFVATKKIPFVWLAICCAWVASFAAYFFLFIKNNPLEDFMVSSWADGFPPYNIFSVGFLKWTALTGLGFSMGIVPFYNKFNICVYLFFPFFLAGLFFVIKQGGKKAIFILLLPLLIHFILAYTRKYPFVDKFLLYQFPSFFIITGVGAKFFLGLLPASNKIYNLIKYGFGIIVIGFCCLAMVLKYPVQIEEIKKSISYINTNIQPAQQVYVYGRAKVVFSYYQETGVVKFTNNVIYGENRRHDIEKYNDDLAVMKGSIWFLFSHANKNEKAVILNYLSKNGTLITSFSTQGSSCYLYTLNK